MNRHPAQSAALLAGLVFVALGVLGFLPPPLNGSGLSFTGAGSGVKLIGEFQVSGLDNIVQILLGVAGVALARTASDARWYLLGGGVAFLVWWLLGIVNAGKWMPVNVADDWLHLAFGVSLVGLAFATSGSLRTQPS
jgi:Domain of unknown function (DUF4383)